MFKSLFSRKTECKRCVQLEAEIKTLRREKEFALERRDKLHRKEVAYLMAEIESLRLVNEKLMKECDESYNECRDADCKSDF